jgi:hypothetical protein
MTRNGIATPVTLVVLLVALVALLAATSQLVLSGLRGAAGEVKSYGAFALAESALDAFPKLATDACSGTYPEEYRATVAGTPVTVPYQVSTSGNTLDVTATAEHNRGRASVRQAFRVSCGFPTAIPAALTSRPRIKAQNNVQIIGYDFNNDTGLLAVTALSASVPSLLGAMNGGDTLDVQVEDATLVPMGSYVQISGKTYRVVRKQGNTLTLKPLSTPVSGDSLAGGTTVYLVQWGVADTYQEAATTLRLADAQGLLPGQAVKLGSGQGTIQQVDIASNTVTVSWTIPPTPPIAEGTPLVPQILGAVSGSTIHTSNQAKIVYGQQPGADLGTNDQLFQRTFGMGKDEFRTAFASYTVSPDASDLGRVGPWGLKIVGGSVSNNIELCGSGILVVFGNLKVNGTCSGGFQGLVYVAGDYDQQGNAVLSGAVVVEGVANVQACPNNGGGDECWTNIAGAGGGKIQYDPQVLLRLRTALSQASTVTPVAGSWRRP